MALCRGHGVVPRCLVTNAIGELSENENSPTNNSPECPSPLVQYNRSSRAPNSSPTSNERSVDDSLPPATDSESRVPVKSAGLVEHTPPTRRCTRPPRQDGDSSLVAKSNRHSAEVGVVIPSPARADASSTCSEPEQAAGLLSQDSEPKKPASTSTPLKTVVREDPSCDSNGSQSAFSDSQDAPIRRSGNEFRPEKTQIDVSDLEDQSTFQASPAEDLNPSINGQSAPSLRTSQKPLEDSDEDETEAATLTRKQIKRKAKKSPQLSSSEGEHSPLKTRQAKKKAKTLLQASSSEDEESPLEANPVKKRVKKLLQASNGDDDDESPVKVKKLKAKKPPHESTAEDEDSPLKTDQVKRKAKRALLQESSSEEEASTLKVNQDRGKNSKKSPEDSDANQEDSALKGNQLKDKANTSVPDSSPDKDSPLKINRTRAQSTKLFQTSSSDNETPAGELKPARTKKKVTKKTNDDSSAAEDGHEGPQLNANQTQEKDKEPLDDPEAENVEDSLSNSSPKRKDNNKAKKSSEESSVESNEDSPLKVTPTKKKAKKSARELCSDDENGVAETSLKKEKATKDITEDSNSSKVKATKAKKRANKILLHDSSDSEEDSPLKAKQDQDEQKRSLKNLSPERVENSPTKANKVSACDQDNLSIQAKKGVLESSSSDETNDSPVKQTEESSPSSPSKLSSDSSPKELDERSSSLVDNGPSIVPSDLSSSEGSPLKNTTNQSSPSVDQVKKAVLDSSSSDKESNIAAQSAKKVVLQDSSSSDGEGSRAKGSLSTPEERQTSGESSIPKAEEDLETKAKEGALQDSSDADNDSPARIKAQKAVLDSSDSDPEKSLSVQASEDSDSRLVRRKAGNLERAKLSKEERLKRRTRFLIRKITVDTDSKLNGKASVKLDTLSIAVLQDLEEVRRVHVKDYPQLRKLCRTRKPKADPNIDRLCDLSNLEATSGLKSKKSASKLPKGDNIDEDDQSSCQISPSKRKRDRRREKEKKLHLLDVSSAEEAHNSDSDLDKAVEPKKSTDPLKSKSTRFDGLKSRNDLAKAAILDSTSGSDNNGKAKMNGQGDSHESSSDDLKVKNGQNGDKKSVQKKGSSSISSNSVSGDGKRKRTERKDPNYMRMKLSETDSSEAEEKAKTRRLKKEQKAKDEGDIDSGSGSGSDIKGSDHDEEANNSSDESAEFGNWKKNNKKKRNKNRIQDSDHDVNASDFEADDLDADSADSDSEIEVHKKKGPGKKRKKRNGNDSSDVLSNDGDDDDEDEARPKKKRKRIKKNSSSDEEGDSDADSPNKGGRKDIRKIISEKKLSQSTKTAAADEKDRRKRMEERQQLYNKTFEIKEGETQEELPLDFNEETKEVLVDVPTTLVKKLKPHQVNGVKFMWDAVFESKKMVEEGKVPGGAILAHCMGLGKTLQTITLVSTVHEKFPGRVSRTLVLCPVNTVKNWEDEFAKWLKGDLEMDVYEMSKEKDNWGRSDRLKVWHQEGGVLIMGYDMFRNLTNEAKKYNRKQRDIFQKSLCDPGPDLVVCDEGHVLKNLKSALNKAMNKIKTKRRILLTGTPLQNNLSEYFAMVNFVKPQLLGTFNEFKNRFVNPIQNGQHSDSTDRDVRVMKKRSFILSDLLKGCMQRLDYNVLVPYLQPKHEFVLCICLTDFQKKLYSYYLENFARAGQIGSDGKLEGGKKGGLFYDVQNLSRVWNHPHILAMAKSRADLKAMDESDDNMDDADETGNLQGFIDDDEASETPNTSEDDARTSSEDEIRIEREVVKKVTRSQQDSDIVKGLDEAKSEALASEKGWWGQFLSEDNELDRLENGSKMLILMDILKECEMLGDKVLVFSQSLLSLDLIEDFLARAGQNTATAEDSTLMSYLGTWVHGKDYFRMDGSTPPDTRKRWCNYFNKTTNHRMRLFLISTKAGGLGINLVAANRVIIFDASWNPAHDVQSIFRVYRFGQTKPVYIYRFLAKGTMEEKIYDRQVTKQSLSARVVDEHQIERHFSVNELATLYEFQDEPIESRPVPKVPKDRLLAELLTKHDKLIWKYHDHDSLLENQVDENLTEEERKAAWEEFENEKKGLVTGVDPAVQALLAQSINPQAIQQQYRLQYPHLSEEQIIQATRALIMQMQSGIHRRPAYDKSHYQQEMARARQQEKALYPGMYRKTDKFTGNLQNAPNTEAWHAQVMQQQRQYSQMQQMQQQIQQSRLQQMQMLQAQLSQINGPQGQLQPQALTQDQEPEEIVLDGAPVMGEPVVVSPPRPSTSRRGRPRLDPDSDLY
ncbi:transcriptional regulator ATRX-like isoform X2 [Tigriopus californicus]|uniref:transcriptional regulator ATRX-like isoform X2 n=1 Tax=Tigriopus californicus TaxID=6832 RepID=UPI0027DA35C0|nr:transcriptional regulator ATRX-like isoform X2 [Tigriopus californicus]